MQLFLFQKILVNIHYSKLLKLKIQIVKKQSALGIMFKYLAFSVTLL